MGTAPNVCVFLKIETTQLRGKKQFSSATKCLQQWHVAASTVQANKPSDNSASLYGPYFPSCLPFSCILVPKGRSGSWKLSQCACPHPSVTGCVCPAEKPLAGPRRMWKYAIISCGITPGINDLFLQPLVHFGISSAVRSRSVHA